MASYVFREAFSNEESPHGFQPVVFDILAPDMETSILPDGIKLVLHVNPTSMAMSYTKLIERIQTRGGWVEQHWGDGTNTISFSMSTGGFMRLYTGLSSISRRETIAYDKYLDLLGLFHNNGSVYDSTGQIVFQGIIKVTFDGGVYLGWFSSFSVEEASDRPYAFNLTAEFVIKKEIQRRRSVSYRPSPTNRFTPTVSPLGQATISDLELRGDGALRESNIRKVDV